MRVVVRLGYSIELRSSPIVIKMNYDANERVAFGNELKSTSPRLVYHYELMVSAIDLIYRYVAIERASLK
jgi:hypothetical protein